ncbi:MAG TPA: hypothetical protein VK281_16705 [Xanthobacteraceae bacterium]|nr:hypothetical protein [Xanthobacteraceae bacterium]
MILSKVLSRGPGVHCGAKYSAALIAGLILSVAAARAEVASADDTARVLAGLPPSAGSPLTPLTRDAAWQHHAKAFNLAFGEFDRRQGAKIHAWSHATLNAPQPTVLYMFSGPDFINAEAFFPSADTYVLSGLEPVGQIPDLTKLPRGGLGHSLNSIERALSSVLSLSFFITRNMKSQLRAGRVHGVLPILYVFLARAGKTVQETTLVDLDEAGNMRPYDPAHKSGAPGVRIKFAGPDGPVRTLYYFTTNLANDGVRKSGFLKFCATLGPADSFLKSASYLPHSGGFSAVRDFLLEHSALVLQDDSGIPVAAFAPDKWTLMPFGHYVGPIGLFRGKQQSKLKALYRTGHAAPIDFGIGYRHHRQESNLLVATRIAPKPAEATKPADPSKPAETR